MRILFVTTLFCLVCSTTSRAQLYLPDKTRHRFAQTHVGVNLLHIPSDGRMVWEGGQIAFPSMAILRLSMGGLHFWGHWDFLSNFTLAPFEQQLDADHQFRFNPSGDLIVRYYPWAVKHQAFRPFVGISGNIALLSLESDQRGTRTDGFLYLNWRGGLSYAFSNWRMNLELASPFQLNPDFYINQVEAASLQLPRFYLSLGLVRHLDVTLSHEPAFQSGTIHALEKRMAKAGALNSISLGIAPSTAFFIQSPTYNTLKRRHVAKQKVKFNWDLSLGFLLHQKRLHLGVSYRDYTAGSESYGLDHLIRRTSLAVEGYKFIWNYNGFVPFIGPSISLERWGVAEFEQDAQTIPTRWTRRVSPGIIFGWDIVPSPLDTWALRTNLRYYPFLRITDLEGKKSRVDQLEFNFIQFVLYPSRLINIPKVKRQL